MKRNPEKRNTPCGSPARSDGFTVVEILLALVICAVLAVLLFSVAGNVRASTGRTKCQNTLRNLHIRLLTYAQDHNSCLPVGYVKPDSWISELKPYFSEPITKLKGETYCPVTIANHTDTLYERDRGDFRTDYTANSNVMTAVEDNNRLPRIPGNLVLLYDGIGSVRASASDAKATARHLKGFNVLFVDGHIEWLSGFDPQILIWKR